MLNLLGDFLKDRFLDKTAKIEKIKENKTMAALDIISNGLNVMMNAQRRGLREVILPSNKMMMAIVKILESKKYISHYKHDNKGQKNLLIVGLKYNEVGQGVMREIKRYSKSSRRVYANKAAVPRVKNGFATVIVSTSKGVMTGKEARAEKVGGEVICHVY